MKNFVYFYNRSCGLDEHDDITCANDLSFIRCWMHKACQNEDTRMIEWMQNALIGTKFNHRLGTLVRLIDIP